MTFLYLFRFTGSALISDLIARVSGSFSSGNPDLQLLVPWTGDDASLASHPWMV